MGLIIPSDIPDFMGNCRDEPVTIRCRIDSRGRVTIKQDDRIALGVDDLGENEKALLEMETEVLARVQGDMDG